VVTIDPSANTQLMGLYRSNGIYTTQCEAEGFRRITYFLDRPDVLATYRVRIEADRAIAPVLLSNGNPETAGALPDGRHFAVWYDPFPKPSYLFALVGGALGLVEDQFTTRSGRQVKLGIYVEPGKEDRCTYAMDALKRSMRFDEEVFGCEYDLDVFNIVAVSDFNMGAMENKGLNIFNDKYVLADPESATDLDYRHIETIVAHEYFHNWSGNRVTCRDWFQLCLKEGLTVFRDQEFTAAMRDRAVKRIEDVKRLRNAQFAEDAGPLAHPVRPERYQEINNFYTPTVYEKGAEIVRMLKAVIGAKAFDAGLRRYFADNDGRAATVEDFVRAFERETGRDLSAFLIWYRQAGTPQITATSRHDAAAQTLTIDLTQMTPATPEARDKAPMPTPIKLGLIGADGADLPLTTDTPLVDGDIFVLDTRAASLVFTGIAKPPVLSLLRGFSAPVRLIHTEDEAARSHRARFDSDPFNRWQAVQDLAMADLMAATRTVRNGCVHAFGEALTDALAHSLTDDRLAPAFKALLLAMPSDVDVARELKTNIDPQLILDAKTAQKQFIANRLEGKAQELYEALTARQNADSDRFSPDAESAGERALRNALLGLLTASRDTKAAAFAAAHYTEARCMTDRIAGLEALATIGFVPETEAALSAFYDRFRDDALVLDKWFALQAAAPHAETLDRVRALCDHKAFSLKVPNRVRALIGTLAMGNSSVFHRADGQGYALVADCVMALDRINPQVAARILSAFKTWAVLEPQRRGKAERVLKRIAASEDLSRDVSDILTRTLAG